MKKIYAFSLIIFLVTIYWSFLIPGPRVAGDFHYSYAEHLKSLFDFPYLWSTRWGGGLGHYVSSLWAWPFELLFGLFGYLGINFSILERLLGPVLVVIIGCFSVNKFLGYYKLSLVGKITGAAFFLSNSYLILLIDGGQLNLAIAYAILPLSFYLYKKYLEIPLLRNLILFSISCLGISIVDLRVIILLALLIGLDFLFNLFITKKSLAVVLITNLKLALFTFSFLLFFNSFWILPIIFSQTTSFVPTNYSSISQLNFLSFSEISNGIFFQQPHWFKNNFGEIENINADFLLLPLLVLLAPIFAKKDLRVGFWLLVTVVFIFLSKGTNPPFSQINSWLFDKVPGFALFRDPTKFFFLIALSYTVLIAISAEEIYKRLKPGKSFLKVLVPLLLVGYFLYLNNPVITMQMNGMFSSPIFKKEFTDLNNQIESDSGFGRIVWIPVKSPLGFESPDHPAVDAFSLLNKRPFAIGSKGTYEKLNFFREATFSGQLLDVTGVQSIVYPFLDYRKKLSEDEKSYYSLFLNQLKQMPYIKNIDADSKIPKLDLANHQDRFFIPQNLWWVIGSDKIYEESTLSANLNLSNNALVFAEESVGLGEHVKNYPFSKILLYNKTSLDFTASVLGGDEIIFPAAGLKKSPDASGWWKRDTSDAVDWKDFLETKYGIINQDFDFGGGWSVAEGTLNLAIHSEKIQKNKVLLTRVLESTNSGEISFYQDDNLIGKVETLKTGDNLRWFEIGKLISDKPLIIKTVGKINVVNALGIIDEEKWFDLQTLSQDTLNAQHVNSYYEAKQADTLQITYSKINPTQYKIKVIGLESPKLLVFSDSFNEQWKLDSKESLPVYSMLNGFVVEKDGEYQLNFSSQKYVYPGLAISILSVLVLAFFLIKTKND